MKLVRVTTAVVAVALSAMALPAWAGNGGAAYAPEAEQDERQARSAELRRASFRTVKATWYGPGFFGNRTACGKRLTRSLQGVAHKRLPCGTRVAISYRGRTTVVPVVDRGPFARGIEFDLTYATARSVGMDATSRIRAATLRR